MADDSEIPVGTVVAYILPISPIIPLANWRACDGSPFNRNEYPKLAELIGDTYGDGRDSSNRKVADHNLPDFRGLFLRGSDNGSGVNPYDPGRSLGTIQEHATALPKQAFITDVVGDHVHNLKVETHATRSTLNNMNNTVTSDKRDSLTTEGAGAHSHKISSGGDVETRPVNVAINWLIKAR